MTASPAITSQEKIELMRECINEIDEQIAKAIITRRQVSQSIQRVKALSGGALVDLNREKEVLATYRLILGGDSGHIAHSILDYSKQTVVH